MNWISLVLNEININYIESLEKKKEKKKTMRRKLNQHDLLGL